MTHHAIAGNVAQDARRHTLCVGASLLASLALGAIIARVGLPQELLPLTVIVVSLVASVAVRVTARVYDVFEPLSIFVLAWGIMFVARPAIMLATGSFNLGPFDTSPGFQRALWMGAVGALGFALGYVTPIGRDLGQILPRARDSITNSTLVAYSLIVFLLGTMLFAAFLMQAGGLAAVESLLVGRTVGQSGLFQESTAYLYLGAYLTYPAGLLLIWRSSDIRSRAMLYTGWLMILPALARAATSGTRSWLFPLILTLVLLNYLRRRKRPTLPTVITAIVVLGFLSTLIAFTRNSDNQSWAERIQSGAPAAARGGNGLSQLFLTGDTEMVVLLAREATAVPSTIPYTWGSATGQVFVHWIPRAFWPSKPRSGDERLTADLLNRPEFGQAPRQYSPMGNFYLDFGLIGCFIGMLLLGVAGRTQWEYFLIDPGSRGSQLLYAAGLPFWIVLLRGSVNDTVPRFLTVVAPLVFALAVLAPRRPQRLARKNGV